MNDWLPEVTGRVTLIVSSVADFDVAPGDRLLEDCGIDALARYDLATDISMVLDINIEYKVLHSFITVGDLLQWVSDAVRAQGGTPAGLLDSTPGA